MSTNVDHVWRLQEGRSKYYKCAACGDVSAYFELPGECVEVMKAALSWYDNNWEETKRDHDLMLANLTATQARCTELLEEVRRLRRVVNEVDPNYWTRLGLVVDKLPTLPEDCAKETEPLL